MEEITLGLSKEFNNIIDVKLQDQEQKIRQQIKAENQKLMVYIEQKRQEKKGFWSKLFKK